MVVIIMSNTWAAPRETLNAYNAFDYPESLNKPLYDYCNRYIGTWSGTSARCTATTPGSIQIKCPDGSTLWYGGPIIKLGDGYKLLNDNITREQQ